MDGHLCDLDDFQIVKLAPEHLDELAIMEKECFSTPWSYDGIANELSNLLSVFYVAKVKDEVVGYISMNAISYEGFINNVAVKKEYRGHGIGATLLNTLCIYAVENDMSVLTLEVRESNKSAIGLYKKFDFFAEGKRKKFYSNPIEDGIIMTKYFD